MCHSSVIPAILFTAGDEVNWDDVMEHNLRTTPDFYRDIFEADFADATLIMRSKHQIRVGFEKRPVHSSDGQCSCDSCVVAS